jgi:dolichol-phosphate mannosyltransferase
MVFIPAYRCAAQIPRVLAQFAQPGAPDRIASIVVVDNQSPDGTIEAARARLQSVPTAGAKRILRNCDNYGLGGSHKVAFRHARETGADYLIVLHGDDQANVADAAPYLASGAAFASDCLLGARFARGASREGYSALRTAGNFAYNALFSLVAGKVIADLGSGLNIYRVAALDLDEIERFPDDLTFNYVMLLWSIYRGHDVRFFPISWREQDQRSNVKLVQQGVRVLDLLRRRAIAPERFFAADHRQTPRGAYPSEIVFEA